jgi:endonuclease/exonuclease/phosphatase family metal-dependent hydrolase
VPGEPILVLTFNLYNQAEGDAAFGGRFGAISDLILGLAPDVVCLQEVPSPDVARMLALGLTQRKQWAMRVAATEMRRPDGWREHLAIIHTGTMAAARTIAAPTGEHVGIGLTLSPSRLSIISAHLNPHSAESRHEQARALLAALPANGPAIVCGDLNATPQGGTLSALREKLTVLAPAQDSPPTFPTGLRTGTDAQPVVLDYILGRDVDVEATGSVGAEPVNGRWASDHTGVWARIRPR